MADNVINSLTKNGEFEKNVSELSFLRHMTIFDELNLPKVVQTTP